MNNVDCKLLISFGSGIEVSEKQQFPKILKVPFGESVPLAEGKL